MASLLSRKLGGVIFSRYRTIPLASNPSAGAFCTKSLSSSGSESDSEHVFESTHVPADPSPGSQRPANRPLENGLDAGIHRAILVGQVGQAPIQKKLKNGHVVTLVSLGTGGIRNNRKPLDNEDPKDYANRSAVQWHRVSIYPERLGNTAKNLVPGSIIYVEGNLETKIFNDPVTGLVRRIREVAIRRNGRLVFLGNGGETEQTAKTDAMGMGYF